MTLNGTAKLLRTLGVYVGLVSTGAITSWVANESLTADDGVLWPAEARRQIRDLANANGEQEVLIRGNTLDLAAVQTDVATMKTDVAEVKEISQGLLRWVCLQPDFARSVECRRVYR